MYRSTVNLSIINMVTVAIRRDITIALLLLRFVSRIFIYEKLCISADSTAFVNKLKSKNKKQPTLLQLHRLHLETSPLIGGPSWLPLHVKVVLKNKELYHKWDLIPIDATNATTLQKLILLQPVPAQIRYRMYTTTTSQNNFDPTLSQQELLRTKIYDANTLPRMSDNIYITMEDSTIDPTEEYHVRKLVEDGIEQEQRYILQAHRFCQSYMTRTNMELHLVWNNCWTFAFQLGFHLLQSSYRDTRD